MGIRNTDMQATATSIWDAGYPCASIPSTWLEKGMLTVRDDGKVQIKDRIFDAVIFLNPQYAKPSSLAFMQEIVNKKGKLMIQGAASKDFNGNDCSVLFNTIAKNTYQFSIDNMPQLGIAVNPVKTGIFLNDGSVVMADYESIQTRLNTAFNVKIDGKEFTGSYEGVFALKTDKNGNLEKLVCGKFKSLKRDGETILELEKPADIMLLSVNGKPTVYLKDKSNKLVVFK